MLWIPASWGGGSFYQGCADLVMSLYKERSKDDHFVTQKFQVPKNGGFPEPDFWLFRGWGNFPYISRIHTAYMTVRIPSILGT